MLRWCPRVRRVWIRGGVTVKGARVWAAGFISVAVTASLATVTPALASPHGSPGRESAGHQSGLNAQRDHGALRITAMDASGHPAAPSRHSVVPLRVADPAAFAREKAAADARAAGQTPHPAAVGPFTPTLGLSAQGINDTCCAPSDSTSAVGTTRFLELVNDDIAIYSKTNLTTPIATDTLNALDQTGFGNVFDPQIIWDPTTKRFYYASDDREANATDNRISFGFSKNASPNNAVSSWCHYSISYGSEFPDYPKLGDTKDFLLFGTNVFDGGTGSFLRTDAVAVGKPANGSITTCPLASSFAFGQKNGLKSADGTPAWTPVPANQIDSSSTGYVVASADNIPNTYLSVFTVKKNTSGQPVFGSARTLTVPSYSTPPDIPQPGTSVKLDSSDTRLTQAVSAIDPSRGTGSSVAIWTQHTVTGGAGAEVRWYEINPKPATPTLFQSGKATDSSLYAFNGSISPDRVANGSVKAFGSNMVLGFGTGSGAQVTHFKVASKIGSGAQSAWVDVANSASVMTQNCSNGVCRWGDYAAATPDPAASVSGAAGKVWLTSQLVFNRSVFDWATWNVVVNP